MRIYHIRRKGSQDRPRICVAADDIHAAAMLGCTPAQCDIEDITNQTLSRPSAYNQPRPPAPPSPVDGRGTEGEGD